MIITILTLVSRFRLSARPLSLILACLALPAGARADDVINLDTKGRQIYEALLDSEPPLEIQNDGTGFGLKLLRVSGHPRYEAPPANGSVAEVIYDFVLPASTHELRLSFLIYPDSKSASDKLNADGSTFVIMSGLTPGTLGIDFHYQADDTFEKEQKAVIFGKDEMATVLFAYQIDRVIITGKTDETFAGADFRDTKKLEELVDGDGKAMVHHAWLLLGEGKDVLDQPKLRDLLH